MRTSTTTTNPLLDAVRAYLKAEQLLAEVSHLRRGSNLVEDMNMWAAQWVDEARALLLVELEKEEAN